MRQPLASTEPVPDHSWLSKTRSRLPLETHAAVFTWVLQRLAEHGLIQGDRIGVDASTPPRPAGRVPFGVGSMPLASMEANAAPRSIVRRDSGEGYREMLKRLAMESGIETPTAEDPAELIADKGYHSRDGLKELEDSAWKSRIAEKKVRGVHRWHGDEEARRAVYNNRARLRSGAAKEAFMLRAELVERSFALTLDRGGMRRAWLRGRENLHKRYLVHVAGYNLGLIMRLLVGAGAPREFLARVCGTSGGPQPQPRVPPSSSSLPQPTPKQRYSSSAPSRRRQTDIRLRQRPVNLRRGAEASAAEANLPARAARRRVSDENPACRFVGG